MTEVISCAEADNAQNNVTLMSGDHRLTSLVGSVPTAAEASKAKSASKLTKYFKLILSSRASFTKLSAL